MLLKSILWTCFTISTAIKVPSSWKDEQTFLPYYVVVDGLPSAQNVETYYPENAASDQVVQNDVVVKLFQKMNPNLAILKPQQPLENPSKKLAQKPVLIDKSFTHVAQEKRQEDDGESENNHEEAAENLGVKAGGVDHENPGDIPTKPIYPGEGQWARKGLKHRPHISKNLLPQKEEKEEGPDTAGTDFYNAQKDKFQKDFDEFPKKHNLYQPRRQTKKNEDFEEKAASEDFEPYRTYAQVRKTITKKRLPKKKKTDPRLRESIKDSKIHTVYSEEGYEDSAYDHGDQEKQAESREKEKGADPENFPEPPPPPSEDEESLEVDEESDKPKDEKESESKSESVVEPKEAPTDQEGHLIDNMMDESKYGKKTAKPKFIIKVRRKRRSTEELDPKKYPHYTSTKVNSLSSLRYVENPSNIPKKGAMSFYKEADKMECPEVMDVDPIPDKIKDGANHTDESNSTITTPKPKLDKLGDQIDCFKTRYFGEDPLDNPLFKEEAVDTPNRTPNRSFLNDGSDEENLIEDRESKDLTDENLPEPQPYILVKRIYRRPQRKKAKRTKKRPPPPKFDQHPSFYRRPQRKKAKRTKKRPPPPKFDQHPSSSNSERISEVHYKDEINPSEQMNVFADIINNIKNLKLTQASK
ncbi:hypothetical protein QE152_g36123 [Popillia japonica]|uniref:Uncharacterized protein n=1 Tax=Popillia japonica TaxID=7064 RepID=A0AAW1IE98_POPJA